MLAVKGHGPAVGGTLATGASPLGQEHRSHEGVLNAFLHSIIQPVSQTYLNISANWVSRAQIASKDRRPNR